MTDQQPPATPLTTSPPTCQPQPASAHWPIGDTTITCGPTHDVDGNPTDTITLDITLQLAAGVRPDQDFEVSLLYVVNGSLDYSKLFSQMEVARHTTAVFKAGQTETSFQITTLPIPPHSTFELEILTYIADAGTIIHGVPQGAGKSTGVASAADLNIVAVAALLTGVGALLFFLLHKNDG